MSKKKESDEIYNLISNQIGDFLREKIKEKGYNIKEIAKSLNVNSSTVYRWITFNPDQRILPKLNMLLKISRVLNLNKKEMKELLNIFYTSQFPNLYGIFPPDENYLKYLCYDGDRNLYEDKLQKAEFYYKLILDSIEKFFGSQKAIKEPFLSIYLHANYGLTYIYVIYKNWNGVKKNINKTRYFLNKLRYSNYYYQNHYIRLVLWVNTQNFLPAKYYYWIDNLEKEIIKYYEEGDDQPLYIHRKEILIAHLERYKALILENTLEAENILNSITEKLFNIGSIGTRITTLVTWGRLILEKGEKDFKRGISLIETALNICKEKQKEFDKIGVWREKNKNLISNLPLQVFILLSLADIYFQKNDLDTAKYFAKESLLISDKIGLIKEKNIAEKILMF